MTIPNLSFLGQGSAIQQGDKEDQDSVGPNLSFLSPPVVAEPEDDPANVGFWSTIGNLYKYAFELGKAGVRNYGVLPLTDPQEFIRTQADIGRRQIEGLKGVGRNIGKTFEYMVALDSGLRKEGDKMVPVEKDVLRSMQAAPYQAGAQALAGIGSAIINPIETAKQTPGMASELVKMFFETPVEAITATTNIGGVPVPATPEEQTKHLQEFAAMAVSTAIGIGASKALVPGVTGQQAIEFLGKNSIGNLARAVKADIIAGAAGGAAYSSIADLGAEDYGGRIISTGLVVLPVGVLAGAVHTPFLYSKAIKEKAKVAADPTPAQHLALTNVMKVDAKDSAGSVLAKTEAFATADGMLEAVVKAQLELKQGVIVPDLTPAMIAQLKENFTPRPLRVNPVTWHPSVPVAEIMDKIKNGLDSKMGIPIRFSNDFDAATYSVRMGRKSQRAEALMDDLVQSTGLTERELMSHGKAVSEALNKELKDIAAGKPNQGQLNLPPQQHQFEFGRKTYEFNVYEGPNGTSLITPETLPDAAVDVFKRSGFIPGELIESAQGKLVVQGVTKEGKLRAKALDNGKFRTVDPLDVARVSSSFDSQLVKHGTKEAIELGTLTPDSWLDKMYQEFSKISKGSKTFAENFDEFLKKIGMTSQNDAQILAESFYGKIQKEILDALDPDTKQAFIQVNEDLKDFIIKTNITKAEDLYNKALQNEMYIASAPNGKNKLYEIRSLGSGQVLHEVNTYDDAMAFLNKVGQIKTVDLDGGNGNLIPPAAFKPSVNMARPYGPQPNTLHPIDVLNLEFNKFLPPVRNLAASIDRAFNTNVTLKVVEPLDRAQTYLRQYLVRDMAPAEVQYNAAFKRAHKLKLDRNDSGLVTDYVEVKHGMVAGTTTQSLVQNWKANGVPQAKINDIIKVADDVFRIHKKVESITGINYFLGKSLRGPNALERDAFRLTTNYIFSAAKEQSIIPIKDVDFLGQMKNLPPTHKFTYKEIERIAKGALKTETTGVPEATSHQLSATLLEYLDAVKGIPSAERGLSNAMRRNTAIKSFFRKILPDANDLASRWLIATQGGIPMYAVRDYVTGVINVYSYYGTKFATKFVNESITGKYAQALMDKGEIPNVSALNLLMPTEDIMLSYSKEASRADFAMRLSGQHIVYAKQSAALYKLTLEEASSELSKLIRNTAKKDEVYRNLKLSSLPAGLLTSFDQLVSNGNAEGASRLLARWRVKQLIGDYGRHNNPVGWNGNFGRLLGQGGSWSFNQIQTVADMTRGLNTPGTRIEAAGRLARFTIANGSLLTAGAAAGFNLASWMAVPYAQIGGPVVSVAKDAFNGITDISNPDPTISQRGWSTVKRFLPIQFKFTDGMDDIYDLEFKFNQVYIPYGRAVQNYYEGWKWWTLGEDPVNAIMRSQGVNTVEKAPPLSQY